MSATSICRETWLAVSTAAAACCLLWSGASRAEETDHGSSPVEIHGFVSQGFIKSTANNYLTTSERGSFDFTEVGLNFTKTLTDRLRVGVQLFTRDLGPLGNYKPQFDWFYLDYRFEDWLGLRAGRTKIPFGLYNETNDIDAARVPILLPQSVYPVANRDYLLAQTGGELYGNVNLGNAGGLEYRAYGGTIFLDTTGSTAAVTEFSVPYLAGGRLMWQTPLEGLQAGGSLQGLRLDFDYLLPPEQLSQLQMAGKVPADFKGLVSVKAPVVLWVGSVEYQMQDWLFAAEYSRWHVSVDSSVPGLFPPTPVSERFYGMTSYHVTPWFTPGVYYSALFPNADDRTSRRDLYQHDVAATVRFDINPYWLLKVEGHVMHGTAGLTMPLNDNRQLKDLTRDWGVFLLKTTAYF